MFLQKEGRCPEKFITGCPELDEPDQEEKPEPEVRLLSAQWKPGPEGYQYNKQCFLEVKTEYIKKTARARIRGKLYGIFNGVEEDMLQDVEGFIDNDNKALLDIKKLWFVDDHYRAWKKDKTTPVQYKIKEISHSRGENVIDGPVLEMPYSGKICGKCLDINDEPVAELPFSVLIDGEIVHEGVTDEVGLIKAPIEEGREFRTVFHREEQAGGKHL